MKAILTTTTAIFLLFALAPQAFAQGKQSSTIHSKPDVKFLEDISVEATPVAVSTGNTLSSKAQFLSAAAKQSSVRNIEEPASSLSIEEASKLQFKYALLMDTEVELVQNISLMKIIDEWLGTRYRYGGASKSGIDCSALMQVFFASLYGASIPRTARQQYDASRKISRAELKEGDLVFFNTTGGVSHVGFYLQNNKFAHAASSEGVTISDLYDSYWVNRFIGAGRIEDLQPSNEMVLNP
jgi:lipoprotein Spr